MAITKTGIFRSILVAATGLSLGGCTTFSFAPPLVETEQRIANQSSTSCNQYLGASYSKAGEPAENYAIDKNVDGALYLIDNFLRVYRCASREAVDGRQTFEVPSFLALLTGALGPTYGLTEHGRIAAVAGAGAYGVANSYYAPKEKARLLDSALDAVLCIKTEAVGAGYFDTRAGGGGTPDAADQAAFVQTQSIISQFDEQIQQLDSELAVSSRSSETRCPRRVFSKSDGRIEQAKAEGVPTTEGQFGAASGTT